MLVVAALVLAVPAAVAASSPGLPPAVIEAGILGLPSSPEYYIPSLSFSGVVPRNVAVVGAASLRVEERDAALIQLNEDLDLYRTTELLPGGAAVVSVNGMVRVGRFVDDEAPSRPTIRATFGSSDGCGEGAIPASVISVSVDGATDDHTPREHLTYVLYIGATEAEALETTTPHGLFADAGFSSFWVVEARALRHETLWVGVAVLDQAGNLSERSAAMNIHNGSGGCAVTDGAKGQQTGILVLLTLAWLGFRSRRGRTRAESVW